MWGKNKQWMELLAGSSTPLFISAQPDALGATQQEFIRQSFAMAARPLGLLQEALRERPAVRELGELVGECVLLLRFEQLRVPDGDRRLRGDTVEEVGLVIVDLVPGIEVELHRAHQLAGALDRHDERRGRRTRAVFARLDRQRGQVTGDAGKQRYLGFGDGAAARCPLAAEGKVVERKRLQIAPSIDPTRRLPR